MFFNRQKIFDLVNETLGIESIQGWEEQFLNGTIINGTTTATIINGTMNSRILVSSNSNFTEFIHQNGSGNFTRVPPHNGPHFMPEEPLFVLILVTVCYAVIFIAGILGNLITCLVIYRNKSMHTATNFYLANLAISDLTLLLLGMPQDAYNIWFPHNYTFSTTVCLMQALFQELTMNATILTIVAFTIERYIAICHPFRQHTMSKLSRAVKFIMGVWIVAFAFAIPQAIQFDVVSIDGGHSCTVRNIKLEHAFEISSFLFFVGPMTLICVLYVLIGIKLKSSKTLQGITRDSGEINRSISGQTRIIRMLIAVAVAFFLCWAPFHAQRLMAVYGKVFSPKSRIFMQTYTVLTYVSGVLYFMSTCINPLLYSIMSLKFRNAFKATIIKHCGFGSDYMRPDTYSMLSRYNGIGSLKLSIANATNNRRTSNIYINDVSKKMQNHHQIDATDSTYAEIPSECTPALLDEQDVNHLRQSSKLNQSPSSSPPQHHSKKINDLNNLNGRFNLSQIASKGRRQKNDANHNTNELNTIVGGGGDGGGSDGHGRKTKSIQKITSTNSIYSTSTISNSSLQEYDDNELDTTELAKYMKDWRQTNKEIHHDAK